LSLKGEFTFSPVADHVPEETIVTLFASATDYLPGRKPALSPAYRIYILSRAMHAKLAQEQMEQIQGRLEDLAREEERILDGNRQISRLSPEELAGAKPAEEIKNSELAEKQNAEKLSRLASDGANLLKEALRNKDISESDLRKWAELLEKMKETSEGDMKNAEASLQKAANSTEQRPGELGKAMESEQRALDALKNMAKSMTQAMDNMLAKSFVNRLRAVSESEQEVAGTFKRLLPEIVGAKVENLSEENRNTIGMLGARQDSAKKEAKYIQDDLAGFFNRTRIQCYNTIHEQMGEKKTQDRLEALAGLIRQNVGAQVIEDAVVWRDQFKAWADMLAGEIAKNNDRQEENANELSQNDIEALIAMMRIRQREESLREQTRLIEEGKDKKPSYGADSRKLAGKQSELANDTAVLERKARNPDLKKLLEKIDGEMMNASVYLRRPQTDAATIAIETEIIELLSAAISSSSCQGSQCQGAMLALMKAMGMRGAGTGKNGGGSMAGGTTEKPNINTGGTTGETPVEKRPTTTTGGADTSDWPTEYKDLLDAYFNSLEEHK
jgi:hypothetical protein